MKIPSFRSLTVSLLALVLTSSFALAGGGTTEDVKSGTGVITLDSQVRALLALAHIDVIKVAPGVANRVRGTITVPITGGALYTSTGDGEIATGGGFMFSDGTNKISAIDYVLTVKSGQATVTALVTVNGALLGRIDLASFALSIPTPVVVPKNKKIKLQNLSLDLSAAAATALNNAFSTSAFSAGQNLGAYNVTIVLAAKTL